MQELTRLTQNSQISQYDSRTQNILRDLAKYDKSETTKEAYVDDIMYFTTWLRAEQGLDFPYVNDPTRLRPGELGLPLPHQLIVNFVAHHLEGLDPDVDRIMTAPVIIDGKTRQTKTKLGPHTLATVKRRLAALSVLHEVNGFSGPDSNPCKHPLVKAVFRTKERKNASFGIKQTQKDPITLEQLNKMLEHCGHDLAGTRDRAMLLFGFATGGRRRSEISSAAVENLKKHPDGFTYYMGKSKTNQDGKSTDNLFPVFGEAGQAMRDWLEMSGITTGPVFRAIDRYGHIGIEAISDKAVNLIVKKYAELIGYNPADYGAHSLRAGFATETGLQGIPEQDAMRLTTHKDIKTFRKYRRLGDITNNPASRLACK